MTIAMIALISFALGIIFGLSLCVDTLHARDRAHDAEIANLRMKHADEMRSIMRRIEQSARIMS